MEVSIKISVSTLQVKPATSLAMQPVPICYLQNMFKVQTMRNKYLPCVCSHVCLAPNQRLSHVKLGHT